MFNSILKREEGRLFRSRLLLLLYNFADQREFPLEVLQETSIPNSASGKSTRRSVHLIAF